MIMEAFPTVQLQRFGVVSLKNAVCQAAFHSTQARRYTDAHCKNFFASFMNKWQAIQTLVRCAKVFWFQSFSFSIRIQQRVMQSLDEIRNTRRKKKNRKKNYVFCSQSHLSVFHTSQFSHGLRNWNLFGKNKQPMKIHTNPLLDGTEMKRIRERMRGGEAG